MPSVEKEQSSQVPKTETKGGVFIISCLCNFHLVSIPKLNSVLNFLRCSYKLFSPYSILRCTKLSNSKNVFSRQSASSAFSVYLIFISCFLCH